jgi:uncharacterized damage-inducible protein DinB
MSGLTLVRELFDYHWWANRRLWDVASALGEATATRELGKQFSFVTLKGTFAHLYAADFVWFSRFKGTSPDRLKGDADFASMKVLREQWDALEDESRAFIAGLGDADLDRALDFRDTAGRPGRLPLGGLLQHVANHATHHRSEIATMLTMVSGSPPPTDLVVYLRITHGQAS